MTEMRLQKYLAMNGVDSRRKCEELITSGRVQVNGKVVTILGTKVDPDRDEVHVDGERKRSARRFYIALYKPPGFVCTTNDPAGRPRVVDLVARIPARLFPIGRLDEDSEGLLLMTNDGDFAQKVAHPRYEVAKVYRVIVKGEPEPAALQKLREGVWLSDGRTAPAKVYVVRTTREFTTFTVTLHESRQREVRRMLANVGLRVTKLLRDQVGVVRLGTLKRGEWRPLTPWEIELLQRSPAEHAAHGGPGPSAPSGPAAGHAPRRGFAGRSGGARPGRGGPRGGGPRSGAPRSGGARGGAPRNSGRGRGREQGSTPRNGPRSPRR
jgi:23S rRNA pseudouridine2605 synthase